MTAARITKFLPVASLSRLPRTEEEAREMARSLNAQEKRTREELDAMTFEEQQKEMLEQLRARGIDPAEIGLGRASSAPAARRLDAAAIYRDRNAQVESVESTQVSSPRPRRPRTFGEIARARYGGGSESQDLIANAPRGGR